MTQHDLKFEIYEPKPNESVVIYTDRFIMRPLTVADVSQRYAGWLVDEEASGFICNRVDFFQLKKYVEERIDRNDILFLGIFEINSGVHVGNIKYEPVDSELGYAVLGILIGEKKWRGKGVAGEVIKSSATWLRSNRNIRKIALGVNKFNLPAITAYKKIGFIVENFDYLPPPPPDGVLMVLQV